MSLFNFGASEISSGSAANCHSLSEVPGKMITKSFGMIYYTEKNIAGNAPQKTEEIFSGLYKAAQELGANAVINVKIAIGSYHPIVSKMSTTYVIAYGDAVTLTKI